MIAGNLCAVFMSWYISVQNAVALRFPFIELIDGSFSWKRREGSAKLLDLVRISADILDWTEAPKLLSVIYLFFWDTWNATLFYIKINNLSIWSV